MESSHRAAYRLNMVNDAFTDKLSIDDRGFAFGDGLFESMLYLDGQIPFLDWHLRRLLKGAEDLGLLVDQQWLCLRLDTFLKVARNEIAQNDVRRAKIKLTLTRARSENGCYPDNKKKPSTIIQLCEIHADGASTKVQLHSGTVPLGSISRLLGIKHLSRLPYVVAALGFEKYKSSELLFVDEEGRIVETMHHNIFFIDGDKVYTPKLDIFGVAGIARQIIFEKLADRLNLIAVEEHIHLNRASEFEACFIANAVRGLSEVETLDGHSFSSSPQYLPLEKAFLQYMEQPE